MRLLLLMFLLVNFSAWSQNGNVGGKVTFNDKEHAFGATVMVMGTQKYVVVDNDGRFEIKGLPYGVYTLEVSSAEAQTKTVDIVLDRPSLTVAITIEKKGAQGLKEVVIQKTSVKKEIINKGFSVNVIETEEAAKRNLQTNDLLDRSVGVRIRQNGGLGSRVDYNLNGMSGNAVRVFIDGISISTYGPSFSLNSIPPALIERIEVYKGVIPAHLADDALGGAINVILKNGAKNTLNASVSYGSFNTFQANLNASYRAKSGFTVKASGFSNYSDNDYEVWGRFVYNINPGGQRIPTRVKRFESMYRSYGGRIEAGFTKVKWADAFLIGYNGSADYNQIQHGQYMTKPYKGRFTESEAHVLSLNYAKKDFLVKGLEFTLNAVYSQRNEIVNDTVKWVYNWDGKKSIGIHGVPLLTPLGAQQGAATLITIKNNILNTRAALNYSLNENHKITIGSMFYDSDRSDLDIMKPELQRTYEPKSDYQKSITSLGYEMSAFENRLKTNLFGKFYEQKYVYRNWSLVQNVITEKITKNTTSVYGYGFAGSYYVTPKVMVSASAERAYRLPSDDEIFGRPGQNILPNLALGPELSNNLNVGLRFGPYKYNAHKISWGGSYFWRNSEDKIAQRISDRVNEAIEASPYVNVGRAQSVGFEASAEYVYDNRLFVSLNMSKFNSLYKTKYDSNGNLVPWYNRQLPNEPFFTVNGSVQYNFKNIIQSESEFNLYYNFGYVAPFYTSWQKELDFAPAQFPQDLGASYTFPNKKFVVSLDARNIFNEQIYDNFGAQKPGRAFYVKLNYTISKF
ncbi:TonB-dependent receptor [Flavobacterium sp. ABG]|uniref:TonB-dependent receptor n=1 Tax=Flavobacterium sp. ABG TaxID=1423322 RepID=UPI000649F7CA|nr:TonB-dependent receptor plug domain-containing protein [Flavobacterium sp. ABG]KLT69744.1 TonB-dependent receptor [Flavobacterium sp. ABG]